MIKFYAFLSLKMVEISRFFTNYGEKIKISFFDRDSMRASRMNTLNRRVFVIRPSHSCFFAERGRRV